MLVKVHPDNPEARKIDQIAQTLLKGGVIIIPTDTIYALACDLYQTRNIFVTEFFKSSLYKNLQDS